MCERIKLMGLGSLGMPLLDLEAILPGKCILAAETYS